jgi:hypothetical protein
METGAVMKALIERQLYRPALVLPLLILMRLMVTLDFNLTQVTLVVIAKGSQYVFWTVVGSAGKLRWRPEESACHEKICHC